MSLLKRIIFATDFSDGSARAQDYAILLASAFNAKLEILHVLELLPGLSPEFFLLNLDEVKSGIDLQLDEIAKQATSHGASASARQVMGIASEEITKAARDEGVDLVVVGTHGRTGLDHILVGSTAERVIKRAPCPVLAVRMPRERPEAQPAPAVTRILVPIDFSDLSLDALE